MKRSHTRALPLLLLAVVALAADDAPKDVDINAFEEFTPQIQEVEPADGQARKQLEEITVKPIELGKEKLEFEEYRPVPAPEPVPAPKPVPVAPTVKAEPPLAPPAPTPAPAPIVQAPLEEPVTMAEPTPPARPAPVIAPPTPTVKMVDRAPVLPPAAPAPLIPVAPPPERQKLRVPEEVQVAQSYRPEGLDLTLDKNYEQELSDLQKQLALLRERVIETKSRIITYGERVSRGFTAGTRVLMKSENQLGDDFALESVTYYLDGHQIYSKRYDGEQASVDTTVYKGSILPGKHKIDMEIVLRADDGLFDFSRKARLKYTTSEYFTANEGKQLSIKIRMFDKGGLFAKAEERPGISFEIAEEDAY